MFHISLILLPFFFTILSVTTANPYPSEVITNESLSNQPANKNMDKTYNEIGDDEMIEDYLDQIMSTSQPEPSADLSSLYSLTRKMNNLLTDSKRLKRPSWATIGKREKIIAYKRPSWAHIG